MKLYYIAPKQAVFDNTTLFFWWWYRDLPDGTVLLATEFDNEMCEQVWAALPGVQALPHPLSREAIGPIAAGKLAGAIVNKQKIKSGLDIQSTDTAFDVASKFAVDDPQMHLTAI